MRPPLRVGCLSHVVVVGGLCQPDPVLTSCCATAWRPASSAARQRHHEASSWKTV